MLPTKDQRDFAASVATFVHADKKFEAAKAVSDFCQLRLRLEDNPAKYLPVLAHWLHFLLNNDAPEEAAQLLWTPTQFTPEPKFAKAIWKFFDESTLGLIMGAGSCGKSYSLGVRLFLEWLRDSEYTSIRVIGPSQNHLSANLFSHLVGLHQRASLPMPGVVGDLFIGLDRRNQLSSIKGIVIPVGQVKKAGRLQGVKRMPRKTSHPIFGNLSRLFVMVDEIENVPTGLFSDIDNVLSQVKDDGSKGFKIFGAYNPRDQNHEVGKRAEPPFGWAAFNPDEHFRWKSVRGWDVLRLDGEHSENVIQGKEIYPGLQTREGLEAISRNAGGKQSAGYFTMGRGAYPPQGVLLTVIPPGMLQKMRGEFIWYNSPQPVGACDLALEGGSAAVYTLGKWGQATGMKLPPSIEFPVGNTVMFKDSKGHVLPCWGLQADQQFTLPKGDTIAMKTRIIEICKKAGVRPEYFSCDRTGHGAGIADLIKFEWGQQIHDVNYSSGPSKTKILLEDTKTCWEEYERMNTELWFAFRKFAEFTYLLLSPVLDLSKLGPQLTNRKVRISAGRTRVEAKKDYLDRGYESPDEADSLTLLVHAARMGSNIVPSMKRETRIDAGGGGEDDWFDGLQNGVRLDPTSRTDFLDQ